MSQLWPVGLTGKSGLRGASVKGVAVVGATSGAIATGGSMTLAVPAGTQVGDYLLVVGGVRPANTSTMTAPGFTVHGSVGRSTSGALVMLGKFAAQNELDNGIVLTYNDATQPQVAGVIAARNVHATTPVDAAFVGSSNGTQTSSQLTPSITTVTAGALVVRAMHDAIAAGTGLSHTWPVSTERVDVVQVTASPVSTAVTAASSMRSVPGATGTETVTLSSAASIAACAIALRPAS